MAREFRVSGLAESEMETALLMRGGKVRGWEIVFECPSHEDSRPSASYNIEKHVWTCRVCGAGGGFVNLQELVGIR